VVLLQVGIMRRVLEHHSRLDRPFVSRHVTSFGNAITDDWRHKGSVLQANLGEVIASVSIARVGDVLRRAWTDSGHPGAPNLAGIEEHAGQLSHVPDLEAVATRFYSRAGAHLGDGFWRQSGWPVALLISQGLFAVDAPFRPRKTEAAIASAKAWGDPYANVKRFGDPTRAERKARG
jgi:hypothetical protein